MQSQLARSRTWQRIRYSAKQIGLLKLGKRIEQAIRRRRKKTSARWSGHQAGMALQPEAVDSPKSAVDYTARLALQAHLTTGAKLAFPAPAKPKVSIILVLFNRAELTYQCLQSLLAHVRTDFEVVIYDNGSTDLTGSLLATLENVTVIRDERNLGYVKAINRAVAAACSEYILLLNNDTQVTSGAVETGISVLNSDNRIGAVGARIILPGGELQEAGSIIWNDGSTLGYARGKAIESYEVMFQRTVDYCSAAFMLLRRDLFNKFEGLDEGFSPAYYEEVDLCARLNEAGLRFVYDPRIVLLHYEFGSSNSSAAAVELQQSHRARFVRRNQSYLSGRPEPCPEKILSARTPSPTSRRVLMIEDRIPHPELGSGFPRSNVMLHAMIEMGYEVTLFPMHNHREAWPAAYRDLPRGLEIVQGADCPSLAEFLNQRRHHYGALIISRPHNMEKLDQLISQQPDLLTGTKIIYDAEAIFSLREIERLRQTGIELSSQKRERMLQAELGLAGRADAVLAVSAGEAEQFAGIGKQVHVLGHAHEIHSGVASWENRNGLLFVGAVHDESSPNAQSLVWLCEQIMPELNRRSAGTAPAVNIAGTMLDTTQAYCRKHHCGVLGRVDCLADVYNSARVFIAPTQFAAGIPLKIIEATAHGVPVVATSLLANQLQWTDGRELLVADTAEQFAQACLKLHNDPELWLSIRQSAQSAVAQDYSQAAIRRALSQSLSCGSHVQQIQFRRAG